MMDVKNLDLLIEAMIIRRCKLPAEGFLKNGEVTWRDIKNGTAKKQCYSVIRPSFFNISDTIQSLVRKELIREIEVNQIVLGVVKKLVDNEIIIPNAKNVKEVLDNEQDYVYNFGKDLSSAIATMFEGEEQC